TSKVTAEKPPSTASADQDGRQLTQLPKTSKTPPMIDAQRQSIPAFSVNQLAMAARSPNHHTNRPPLLILIDAPLSSRLSCHSARSLVVKALHLDTNDRHGCSILDRVDYLGLIGAEPLHNFYERREHALSRSFVHRTRDEVHIHLL